MHNILIIEDNTDLNHLLAEALTDAGYQVKSSYTGVDDLQEIKDQVYDLILLDLMLPFRSGDELLRELRRYADTPVIVISAKGMVDSKIELLGLGADDYITKPFDLGEVVARVQSNLRRSSKPSGDRILRYRDLTLHEGGKRVRVGETELELTAKEYGILELLLKHPGKVYTKANLYETLWQDEYIGDDNAVKTHLSNLRSKLKKTSPAADYIETVWGLGYRLYPL
ncbi:response regulator transcription factor [Paenibacillus sp. 1P07SE]|uniref:response regulator transcription factor n=1 Tax=Paenibacillus sp. 1P07SE TaxID=3132209 RepID=UPI0039A5CCD0